MTQKRAGVILRNNKYYFRPYAITDKGLSILHEPILIKNIDSTPSHLGETLLIVLGQSEKSIEHPRNWDDFGNEHYKLMNVNSWEEIMLDSKFVAIEFLDNIFRFSATKNLGLKEGFSPLDRKINLELSFKEVNPKALGDILLNCFDLCE